MSKRTVVEWSPHDASLFAVGADTLRLFEVTTSSSLSSSRQDAISTNVALTTQRKRAFRVVRINAKVAQLKCLQWYPFNSKPLLIATGTGSGKILLCDFEDARARVLREFVPKYSRPCHAIAWNPSIPNQLATGFEKVRSDFCTLVWDFTTTSTNNGGSQGIARSSSSSTLESLVDQDKGNSTGRKGGNTLTTTSIGVGASGYSVFESKPMYELANSEATMALSWVPLQPTCLATGTGFKWLRVYDLRGKNTSPMSVVAHNKAVLGVVFDYHRPHLLATYSDGPQEPVKVWDIRQLHAASGPLLTLYQTSKNLAQVSWCPSKSGILVTASMDEKWVSLWDVTKHESGSSIVKKPFRRRYTSEPLTSFSWQHVQTTNKAQRETTESKRLQTDRPHLLAAAFPNRLLTASITGEIGDISVHDAMPLSLSSHGELTFGCGKLLFGGVVHGSKVKTSVDDENHVASRMEKDISIEMYRLAKQGYALNLSTNRNLFNDSTRRSRALRNLWLWVDQIESLYRIRTSVFEQSQSGVHQNTMNSGVAGSLRGWPLDPNTLVVAGVKNLLTLSGESSSTLKSITVNSSATTQEEARENDSIMTIVSIMKTDSVLGCPYYEGLGRRLSLLACSWDPEAGQRNNTTTNLDSNVPRNIHRSSSNTWTSQKSIEDTIWNESNLFDLEMRLTQCEEEGNYARAAALAVFHGDLHAAVTLLQKGAMWITQLQHDKPDKLIPYTSDLLQLIAMSIAGYTASISSTTSLSLWLNMTQQLLKRSEIMSQSTPRYFHAMLLFLCVASDTNVRSNVPPSRRSNTRRQYGISEITSAQPGAYSGILDDITLPLSDRLAFACRYLPSNELVTFLTRHEDESVQFGRLEGILVTGVNQNGIRILQTYLDRTGDVQTLAILAARLSSSYLEKHGILNQWIQTYQELLNQWQLYHERARFDVGRTHHSTVVVNTHHDGSKDTSIVVPPQLFVRCNYCNASLSLAGLLRLGGSHSSWLNRAKPKLTCCPTCQKPLPQCALCLLPFGSLNPYFELAHRRSRQTADAVQSVINPLSIETGRVVKEPNLGKKEYESLAQLSSIPFVEWFTWCQACKHGGHAHHLATWFQCHTYCPVTDCKCMCQLLDVPLVREEQMQCMVQPRQSVDQQLKIGDKTMRKQASANTQQWQVAQRTTNGATFRTHSSAHLRPSGTSSGYPPPFSLSSSNSMANLTSGMTTSGTSNNIHATLSDGLTLNTRLEQMEHEKTKFSYM
ncbi:Uncharacterized conserved protein, contains WD40 repeats [Plasmopara halstedii]|uniref:Uncharacterized conserved protein, contains WD40 repeats n=1 Tax=Plasmopara halstedii TaxID=4781 RepID=A0A0N7L4Q1_PLAHL|nr:Uncharacterized conserved protein, contains WD40 repeats [Plasmopara halstedii]CEG39299.1 Uncharacterized conserved protein, contains WD40 repeats [Plasmopara halstedii]|eukprot:XP_024575668.1 Uncharacterized conserved protein, contains WD40 repeats [Plasmopara halstedii]